MSTQKTKTTKPTKPAKEKNFVVVNFLDIEPHRISFLERKANKHNGGFIPIRYDGKSMYVTYEARSCQFGVSGNGDDNPAYKTGKKISGYSTSISCLSDYENDPYYLKAKELDDFFIDSCHKNAIAWQIGGSLKNPMTKAQFVGNDERGFEGKWKRILKWAGKKNEKTGDKDYAPYPPRMDFSIQTTSTSEYTDEEGKIVQEAEFKPVFYDSLANKLDKVTTANVNEAMPPRSRVAVLAWWGNLSQGPLFGASLKPKAQQFRVYPSEQLATDECLLDDEEDDAPDLGDQLVGDFSGGAKLTKLSNSNPAPLEEDVQIVGDGADDDGGETGDAAADDAGDAGDAASAESVHEEPVPIPVAAPAPVPESKAAVRTKPTRTVVTTPKKS